MHILDISCILYYNYLTNNFKNQLYPEKCLIRFGLYIDRQKVIAKLQ